MDRVALPFTIDRDLRAWLQGHPEGHERAALVFFKEYNRGAMELPKSTRWLATEIFLLDDDWVLSSSACHVEINLRNFPEIYLKCELSGLELGFVHGHPNGALYFSDKDDKNERNILRGLGGCNRPDSPLVALVLCEGHWIGRVRRADSPEQTTEVRHVACLGDHMRIYLRDRDQGEDEIRLRQAAAFGRPFNERLRSMRVAVVGVGGTGSPAATLLARAGVGELILIDGDNLERSNLNRVRGYRNVDVGDPKAATLATYINGLDVGCVAVGLPEYLGAAAIDAISGCDFIFGCTDDVNGRDILNLASRYYAVPLIDTGLTGRVDVIHGQPELFDHRARISLIMPERSACLRCQRVVTDDKLKFEDAIRRRPELKDLPREQLRKEYYLIGGGEEAPGVGPFTSAAADFALATMMDVLQPFRHLDTDLRLDNVWVDFVHLVIHSNEPLNSADCFCCGPNGIELGALETYRLGLPILGKL
jgi:molybdopterin/thiamine biosynthesis adenylyltransferase